MPKTRLSVNINKIATLRNARGRSIPDLLQAARDIEQFGAEGITVHPRPDERHIRYQDVRDLKPILNTEFNIEGNPTRPFLDLVAEVVPNQVTLVPDAPDTLTSDQGWNTLKNAGFLKEVIHRIKEIGSRVSIFIDPDIKMIEGAKEVGTDRIELYTEPFASGFPDDPKFSVLPYNLAAKKAMEYDIGINAGHDLNLQNLAFFKENVPGLLEVSIGHALISDALYYGLENTVNMYKSKLA